MDEDTPLTPLHPDHVKVLRISGIILAIPLTFGALLGSLVPMAAGVTIPAMVLAPLTLLLWWLVFALPWRRYSAKGYRMDADRLQVVSGVLFHKDTVVPFSRVQHIDVERGPIERYYGLATLHLHTAGTHNATISLPGLVEADAIEMREAIRARIRQDTL